MNELHGVGLYGIISPSSDKFYQEQTWACLDIVDESREPSSWHLISFFIDFQMRPLRSYPCQ
jgi:hypothetical protein